MTDVIRCASLQTAIRVMQRLALLEPGAWVADQPSKFTGTVVVRRVKDDDATPA